jgi:tRNA threonylcarbamoyladenosine biosynthesis protein TsaE
MKKYTTNNYKQTQKLGEKFAKEIMLSRTSHNLTASGSVILGLSGNLGGGKTTFLQGFAKGLGIKEKILSPTFVILKKFLAGKPFKNFYHIDCYRLKSGKDILELGLKEILENPENIVAIEWPEKVKKILPKNIITINFKFIDKKTRELTIRF